LPVVGTSVVGSSTEEGTRSKEETNSAIKAENTEKMLEEMEEKE